MRAINSELLQLSCDMTDGELYDAGWLKCEIEIEIEGPQQNMDQWRISVSGYYASFDGLLGFGRTWPEAIHNLVDELVLAEAEG